MLHVGKELIVLGCRKGYDAASLSVGSKGIIIIMIACHFISASFLSLFPWQHAGLEGGVASRLLLALPVLYHSDRHNDHLATVC